MAFRKKVMVIDSQSQMNDSLLSVIDFSDNFIKLAKKTEPARYNVMAC